MSIIGIGTGMAQQPGILGPQIPYAQNPIITALGASLLAGRTPQQGFANFAQALPGAMAVKVGMQDRMVEQREKTELNDAWNKALIAKSQGQPIPPDVQAIIAKANPAIAAKMFEQFLPDGGSDETWFGNPIYVQDADGTFKVGLASNRGNFRPLDVGDSQVAVPTTTMDTGTSIIQRPRYGVPGSGGGEPVSETPKNIAEAESLKSQGASQGDAAANLPAALHAADKMLDTVNKLKTDPYLPVMTGPLGSLLPNVSGSSHRVQSLLDQVQGKTFMIAFETLKGGGQITETEGAKATASLNRLLSTSVNDADYKDALNEFERDIRELKDLARRKAAATPAAPGTQAPMSVEEFMAQ